MTLGSYHSQSVNYFNDVSAKITILNKIDEYYD